MESGEAYDAELRTLDCAVTTRNRRYVADTPRSHRLRPLPLRKFGWVRLQERGAYELCRELNCHGKLGYWSDEPETIRCDLNQEHVYSWG